MILLYPNIIVVVKLIVHDEIYSKYPLVCACGVYLKNKYAACRHYKFCDKKAEAKDKTSVMAQIEKDNKRKQFNKEMYEVVYDCVSRAFKQAVTESVL